MEENRRRRWRDWLGHWNELEVSVGKEDEVDDEQEEEEDREREEEGEKKEEDGADAKEEEWEVKQLEEREEEEEKVKREVVVKEEEEVEEDEEKEEREVVEKEEEEVDEEDEEVDEEKVEREVVEKEKEEVEEDEEDEEVDEEEWSEKDVKEEEREHDNQYKELSYKRRTEDEETQEVQESSGQQDETFKEDESFSESSDEGSDWAGFGDEQQKDANDYDFEGIQDEEKDVVKECEDPDNLENLNEKHWNSENRIPGAPISHEKSEEEEDEKEIAGGELADDDVTESWSDENRASSQINYNEEFKDDQDDLKEEESDEEVWEEDPESDDENEIKVYGKDGYPTDVFRNLREFRDSSLLTDLTLCTAEGKSIDVHSPVLAAVSFIVQERLRRNDEERVHEKDNSMDRRALRWSMSLDPELDHVGLEAVVEFAYTGVVSSLNKDTINQIKAAAQMLGVHRLLDLCKEEETSRKKEEKISAAEQMAISLQSIEELWLEKVGCDVTLEALGASLHDITFDDSGYPLINILPLVHRVILATSSDYFRGMFTLGMRETHQPSVMLPFLLASELEVLIRCSYSGALPLSWRSAFEITSTSLQLQYQPALSLCLKFLQQEINPHSCLDVASFAEAYEMMQLLEVADDFILRQFQKVACTSKFKDLPANQLLKYLNSSSLCVPSELVVFKAVAAWIQAKPKRRLKLAEELMKTIHFPLMTFKEFKEVQSLNMWSHHSLKELYNAVLEDFCSNDTAAQIQCRIYLPKESLVLVGGDQISEDLSSRSISRELWFGNSFRNHTGIVKAMEWRKLEEMPEPARFCHEVAVLKGRLYVIGGKKYYGINDTLNSVYRYDPLQNSWERLADMQEKRFSFSVVVLDGKLYAIAGQCNSEYIQSVEQYCPTTNSWSFTKPLDLPLSGHVAKVLQGQIFVSGGLNNDHKCLASMFLYHPEKGNTYQANMTKPRANHCMETLGAHLYVAGGISTDSNMAIIDQLACELYSPLNDSWTTFMSLPVPHVGAGSAVLEGKFYVLGGYSQEDYSDTKMVHRYDPTTQRWENMGKMPGPNNDIRASLLRLPEHLRL
ncbi:hypothetical protein LDENG_00066280 [Lucifuga dentata]|nr:hypothetical protein LDENG_00066280 [Lucifuga dentata]